MKVYIAYETDEDHPDPYGDSVPSEIDTLSHTIEDATGWKTFNLLRDVLNWKRHELGLPELLTKAKNEIDKSDLIITYLSEKSLFVYFETAYAKAIGKKVIVIHREDEPASPLWQLADFRFSYGDEEDMEERLKEIKTKLSANHRIL